MSNRPGNALSRLCSGARHLFIAAPYIKADALAKVLADVSRAATLICITRWNPHDIAVGAVDEPHGELLFVPPPKDLASAEWQRQ